MTNAHSETGQMAVCCQNLTIGALSSRSALSLLLGALFKKFGLFLNTVVYVDGLIRPKHVATNIYALLLGFDGKLKTFCFTYRPFATTVSQLRICHF
jgi:hypothetical protein